MRSIATFALLILIVGSVSAQQKPQPLLKATNNPSIVWPDGASDFAPWETMYASLEIDEKGHVTKVYVAGLGFPCGKKVDPRLAAMEKAVSDAASKIVFEPPMLDGKPTKATTTAAYKIPVPMGDEPPTIGGKAVHIEKPDISRVGSLIREDSSVVVKTIVNDEGRVIATEALSGNVFLRGPAQQSACENRYAPALRNGQPVYVTGVFTVNFQRIGPPTE